MEPWLTAGGKPHVFAADYRDRAAHTICSPYRLGFHPGSVAELYDLSPDGSELALTVDLHLDRMINESAVVVVSLAPADTALDGDRGLCYAIPLSPMALLVCQYANTPTPARFNARNADLTIAAAAGPAPVSSRLAGDYPACWSREWLRSTSSSKIAPQVSSSGSRVLQPRAGAVDHQFLAFARMAAHRPGTLHSPIRRAFALEPTAAGRPIESLNRARGAAGPAWRDRELTVIAGAEILSRSGSRTLPTSIRARSGPCCTRSTAVRTRRTSTAGISGGTRRFSPATATSSSA